MTVDWQAIARETSMTIESVAFLGEGWTSRAYLVNGDRVFRFPKREDFWPELEREIQFLAETASTFPLQVPRYALAAHHSPAAPHGFATYTHIAGSPIVPAAMSEEERSAAADAIAAFVRALHDIAPARLDVQLPRQDARRSATELRAHAEVFVMPQLERARADALRARFDGYLASSRNFSFTPVVCHADLSADHILAVDQRVVGIIDFSDISLGDPDYDFSSLFIEVGEAFALDVARRYGHTNLEHLRSKLEYFVIADFVDTIVNGDGWALAGQQELAWEHLRR
jgi:aminoglycoside 2''-phosphotransferase